MAHRSLSNDGFNVSIEFKRWEKINLSASIGTCGVTDAADFNLCRSKLALVSPLVNTLGRVDRAPSQIHPEQCGPQARTENRLRFALTCCYTIG